MIARDSVHFKLRFLPISEEAKVIVAQIGKKHILDLTLKGSKSWRSILRHLGEKWAGVEISTLFIHYLLQDGSLSENLIEESRLDNSVWKSLHNHPVMSIGNDVVGGICEVFYDFRQPPAPTAFPPSTIAPQSPPKDLAGEDSLWQVLAKVQGSDYSAMLPPPPPISLLPSLPGFLPSASTSSDLKNAVKPHLFTSLFSHIQHTNSSASSAPPESTKILDPSAGLGKATSCPPPSIVQAPGELTRLAMDMGDSLLCALQQPFSVQSVTVPVVSDAHAHISSAVSDGSFASPQEGKSEDDTCGQKAAAVNAVAVEEDSTTRESVPIETLLEALKAPALNKRKRRLEGGKTRVSKELKTMPNNRLRQKNNQRKEDRKRIRPTYLAPLHFKEQCLLFMRQLESFKLPIDVK
eukprot:gene28413-34303_t